ncbi:hypothetical protein [Pseudomonas sp. 34 E 7]|uniref:hypothetical protein n=1 Tax=Pseudomonas sp. 34 E 7 TaxID=1844102 RepID=UPI0008120B06|nr:hypothetical protein [Pseudomonas sp. 34 E 7]CRN00656.1 hypothetical protein [Pseudomonas sp. 34 E 7]CRN04225.1 hypothetical protein [Pseudomonas sp. 34 E 7]CRN04259.1 hypothetical protein [Pseudomonas sp. 34 E 7]
MSYDIIILKPVGSRTDNLANVDEVLDIGDEGLVLRSLSWCSRVHPRGVVKDESFTIEGSFSGKPFTSILYHLSSALVSPIYPSASFKGFCQSYAIPSRLTHFR